MAGADPSFKSLRAFEATIRLGSMTAAAREIGTSQPAVSQRIRHLEETLGTPLIVRGAKRAVPSAAGRVYYDEVAGAVHRVETATRTLQADAAGRQPRVVIAAHFGFAHLWLLPRLEALESRFPDTRFEVMPVDGDLDTEGRRAELVVRFGRLRSAGGHETPLLAERVYPVCTPELGRRHGLGERLDAHALSRMPLLHMDSGDPRWLDWSRWCRLAGLPEPAPGRFYYKNYPLLMRAAEDGQGCALVWAGLDRDLDPGLLRLEPVVTRPDWGYILSARHHRSANVAPVVSWFREACGC